MDWIVASTDVVGLVLISVLGIYVVLVVLTRISGVRSFSKMSGFDFAITVAIGSVIAGTVMAQSPPLAQGAIVLAVLFAVQMLVATFRSRWASLTTVLDNSPRLIMVGETIFHDQLKAAKMTESDLWSKLREANVLKLEQIELVVAESTGDVSVLHHDGVETRVSPELLIGVRAGERYEEIVSRQ